MKKSHLSIQLVLITFLISTYLFAQQQTSTYKSKSDFMQKVQFGGGLGLSIGSGYTDIYISPSAIYNFSPIVAAGVSLQGGYISSNNYYESYTYGGSLIGLINPIRQIQLSAELEQLRVNTNYDNPIYKSDNYGATALYLGAGYRTNHVTMGVRYDVLHDNSSVYSEAFMPFVRVYF